MPLNRYFTVCELCMGGGLNGPCPGDHIDYEGMKRVLTPLPEINFEQGNETPIWANSPLDQELRIALRTIAPIESIPPLSGGSPAIIGSIPPLSRASPEAILRLLPPHGSQIGLPAPAPAPSASDVTQK